MDRGREFARLVAVELVLEGKRRRITQKQIAAAMHLHPNQISYYIKGSKGEMTLGSLLRAAERLGVNPELIAERAYSALIAASGESATTASPPAGTGQPSGPTAGQTDHPRTARKRTGSRGSADK